MIKSITVTNHLGDAIELSLMNPEKSGFIILDLKGLDPPKANINTTDVLAIDGAVINSAHITKRNITFSLRFDSSVLPIEELRHRCYKYFPIKKRVNIRIETDTRICETYGNIESNEIDIFDDQEGANISIICPNSYLFSEANSITLFSGTNGLFEFPFSNESLTEPLIVLGSIEGGVAKSVYYEGDAATGVVIYIHALGPATNIRIVNSDTREMMSIDTSRLALFTGSGLVAGDEITISTIVGNKYISLLRNSQVINILNCLNRDSDWFQIDKGENLFAYTADSGAANLQFRIENKKVYEGI